MNLNEQATQPTEPEYPIFTDEHGEYCLITLTQGQSAKVDHGDYQWLNQWTWTAQWNSDTASFYAKRYKRKSEDGKCGCVVMARALLAVARPFTVDHRDHDTLNNRRYNLRQCTQSQNSGNRRKSHGLSSQFKGVSWHKRIGKWAASIRVHSKATHLGYFDKESDAGAAYQRSAERIFGEYAHVGLRPDAGV
jgi:hypothetical protein